jgi:hypothetical protein
MEKQHTLQQGVRGEIACAPPQMDAKDLSEKQNGWLEAM